MRRLLCVAGLVLLTVVPARGPVANAGRTPPARCSVEALSVSGAEGSEAREIDRTGHWIGGTVHLGAVPQAVARWHDGEYIAADLPPALHTPSLTGITSDGDFVGAGYWNSGRVAFEQIGGDFAYLTAPGLTEVVAEGIDERGHVVGYGNTTRTYPVPLQWDVATPDQPRVIDVPYDGSEGLLVQTSARGRIAVGPNAITDDTPTYIISPRGRQHALKPAPGAGGYLVTEVAGRWAAGFTQVSPGSTLYAPIRWDLRNHRAPEAFLGLRMFVYGIDKAGVMAGVDDLHRPLSTDGARTDLLPPLPEDTHGTALDSSLDGRELVGQSIDDGAGRRFAVQWTCPRPSSA